MAKSRILASRMSVLSTPESDDALPSEIEHKCEEVPGDDAHPQTYNYFVYHFIRNGRYFWARSYVNDIGRVSVYGPFDSRETMKAVSGSLDDAVLAYLRRRYRRIETLTSRGYVEVAAKK